MIRVRAIGLRRHLSCGFLIFVTVAGTATGQAIERVSVGPFGVEANASCREPSVSWDGRYLAFTSAASNLAPVDMNDRLDVYVRDNQTGAVERVSVGAQGQEGNDFSDHPSISSDGRFISFTSIASNFVPGDMTFTWDVFLRDRQLGTTQCVTLDLQGTIGFPGDNNATGYSSVSADGRYVAFHSDKLNLSDSPPSQYQHPHSFVRDMWAGKTYCVSVDALGVQGDDMSYAPSMSASGRYVAFQSEANLVPGWDEPQSAIYVRDMRVGKTLGVAYGIRPSISADGRYVAYYDLPQEPPYFARIYVRDLLLGGTKRVARGNGNCLEPRLSPNGRYVSYSSDATNLLPGDPGHFDVFRWDRITDETRLVSANSSGSWGIGPSGSGVALNDGRVIFDSEAWNLVTSDTNGAQDVFLKAP